MKSLTVKIFENLELNSEWYVNRDFVLVKLIVFNLHWNFSLMVWPGSRNFLQVAMNIEKIYFCELCYKLEMLLSVMMNFEIFAMMSAVKFQHHNCKLWFINILSYILEMKLWLSLTLCSMQIEHDWLSVHWSAIFAQILQKHVSCSSHPTKYIELSYYIKNFVFAHYLLG